MINIKRAPIFGLKSIFFAMDNGLKYSLFGSAIILLLAGCGGSGGSGGGPVITKAISVFGVNVQATDSVTDEQVAHAANVLAEYLDSDEDGVPNNPEIAELLSFVDATIILTNSQDELEWLVRDVESKSDYAIVVKVDEMTSGKGTTTTTFDPAVKEVIHLVSASGFAEVYPDVFGTFAGSELASAMDIARGGHFLTIPAEYPAGAWFTNTDPSCDYECQVTQYFYWAMTSVLGAQADPARLEDIQGEWLLNTAEKVRNTDLAVYSLLTERAYGLPHALPDGLYAGGNITVADASN